VVGDLHWQSLSRHQFEAQNLHQKLKRGSFPERCQRLRSEVIGKSCWQNRLQHQSGYH
jgi:hypothetical protein